MNQDPNPFQTSYDQVAEEYAARFFDELNHKPLDRALLDYFADQVRGNGLVADLGCGPGQIARYLHDRGLSALGIDLSPEMVKLAQQLSPDISFKQGSMLALDVADGAWVGITAFYSVIHLTPEELPQAMREFHRALQPGGLALLAFHLGEQTIHLDEWWEKSVDLDFHFYPFATIEHALEEAGFVVEARVERRPYEPFEHPSQRAYLFARKGMVEEI